MRNQLAGLGVGLVIVALAACGGRVGGDPGGGGGGSSSGGTSSGAGSSGGTSSGGSGGTNMCGSDADCAQGYQCGFPEAEACMAVGTCFPVGGFGCQLFSPGCACDFTTINIACTGLPDGYSTKPLAYKGTCAHPTPRQTCNTSQDCSPESVCAFPIADGCSATGTCVPRGAMCNMPSMIGCACDGTDVAYGTCSGLPDGDAPKPFLHPGPCEGPDAGMGGGGGGGSSGGG